MTRQAYAWYFIFQTRIKVHMPTDQTFDSFDSIRRDVDQMRGLRGRADELLATRRPTAFDGFGDFLDRVLPAESDRVEQIGRALRVLPGQLSRLRRSELDPLPLVEALAEFARLVGLDETTFAVLIDRDHGRYSRVQEESFARGWSNIVRDHVDASAAARRAWRRVEEDDPAGL